MDTVTPRVSSSVIVSVASSGSATPPPLAVAETVTVLFGASTLLSTAVIVTAPALALLPAAIVRALFSLSVKSPVTAGEAAAAATVRVTVSLDSPLSVAVTVLSFLLPDSSMVTGVSTRVAVGVASSSLIVPVPSRVVFAAAERRVARRGQAQDTRLVGLVRGVAVDLVTSCRLFGIAGGEVRTCRR